MTHMNLTTPPHLQPQWALPRKACSMPCTSQITLWPHLAMLRASAAVALCRGLGRSVSATIAVCQIICSGISQTLFPEHQLPMASGGVHGTPHRSLHCVSPLLKEGDGCACMQVASGPTWGPNRSQSPALLKHKLASYDLRHSGWHGFGGSGALFGGCVVPKVPPIYIYLRIDACRGGRVSSDAGALGS